jgi:CDP-glucose 4,6-dehydratase
MENMGIARNYKGRTVLVTGHSGFKGSWLVLLLVRLGAAVSGFSLEPNPAREAIYHTGRVEEKLQTEVFADIRDSEAIDKAVRELKPDFIFHLAAQPLVRLSYSAPLLTYTTNVIGTLNLLEAIRKSEKAMTCILATSDKCYENTGQLQGYRENAPMGGYDPYSSSKGCCELLISSWNRSFFNVTDYARHQKAVAPVRAGNVIGGGDYAVDRIIPDVVRAVSSGRPAHIRRPQAVRPWQHVLDCLWGYITLGANLSRPSIRGPEGWNFGPDLENCITVQSLVDNFVRLYGDGTVEYAFDNTLHEAAFLMLDATKAKRLLNWRPVLNLQTALEFTAGHYRHPGCTEEQINSFLALTEKASGNERLVPAACAAYHRGGHSVLESGV